MNRLIIILIVFVYACNGEKTVEINIIPKPQEIEIKEGFFVLDKKTGAILDSSFINEFKYFQKLTKASFTGRSNFLKLIHKTGLSQEEHYIKITPDTLCIIASTEEGIMRGMQTIRQLRSIENPNVFPALYIHDFPRFEWRGMLLDCCRHFMDKEFIKRYIDLLAYHKMNIFHWHLTEDQGWRIAIDKYPKLTEIGAWRIDKDTVLYGGYYTQDDIREVVAYAKERHIEVVPEIEMPGHSLAALAAYPELSCTGGPFDVETDWGVFKDIYCAGNDSVFLFIEDVLSEVLNLFPSSYIHIGGDEAPKYQWERCSKCQNRIKLENLHDTHELQSYFIKRVEKFLNNKGRQLIGWDEILEGGLAPSATVQSWRGMEGGIAAAKESHQAIMSPTSHCYFDYGLDAIDLQKVYSFEPIPHGLTEEQASFIIGGECNMWTEHVPQEKVDSKVFPRILAMSEVLWSSSKKDYAEFYTRVQNHYPKLEAMDVDYGYESVPINSMVEWDNKSFKVHLFSGSPNVDIEYQIDNDKWESYKQPFYLRQSGKISAKGYKNDKPYGKFYQSLYLTKSTSMPVKYLTSYHENYPGKGRSNLTDGLIGSSDNFRDSYWQGFFGEDLDVIVDLGSKKEFSEIITGFFQYNLSWIMLPKFIEYYVSEDGKNFTLIKKELNTVSARKEGKFRKEFRVKTKQDARYVKIKAYNYGLLPDWHPAAGSKSWLFADEIRIE